METVKYPLAIRLLHWTMAAIIICMISLGLFMVSLKDSVPMKFDTLYPYHKSFGMLILGLVVIRLMIRRWSGVPSPLMSLSRWEIIASKLAHWMLYLLMIIVPLMGYCMSSSYTQSDGVFFFGTMLPELLPKNDVYYEIFRSAHKVLAFTLAGLIALHVLGVLKHWFFERKEARALLSRMF